MAPADFDPIARSPAFQASLNRLRNDEVLGPTYAHQPDNSVGVVDAVTKDMRDRGVALGNAANPRFSSQTSGIYGRDSAELATSPAHPPAAATGGVALPAFMGQFKDSAQRAWLGRGTSALADMFLAPDSVARIRGMSDRAAETRFRTQHCVKLSWRRAS